MLKHLGDEITCSLELALDSRNKRGGESGGGHGIFSLYFCACLEIDLTDCQKEMKSCSEGLCSKGPGWRLLRNQEFIFEEGGLTACLCDGEMWQCIRERGALLKECP